MGLEVLASVVPVAVVETLALVVGLDPSHPFQAKSFFPYSLSKRYLGVDPHKSEIRSLIMELKLPMFIDFSFSSNCNESSAHERIFYNQKKKGPQ